MGGRVQEVIGLMSKSIKEQAGIHAGKMINKLTSSYETSKQSSISKKAPDTLGKEEEDEAVKARQGRRSLLYKGRNETGVKKSSTLGS